MPEKIGFIPKPILKPKEPKEQTEQVQSDITNEQLPKYQRNEFYPALHTLQRIISRRKSGSSEDEDQPKLTHDQIDAMLLEAIALAGEYLISPENESAIKQKQARIKEFKLFQKKSGGELADVFLNELCQEKKKSSKEQKTSNKDSIKQDIEDKITEIFSNLEVKDEFEKLFSQETSLRKNSKLKISEIINLENAINIARARYRQAQNEPKSIDTKSASLPTDVVKNNLAKYLEIIEALEQRITIKEAGLSYRELGLLESRRLLKTRQEMKEFGFAITESRQALFDRISELASAGFKIFLGGPTGTGKTSLAVFAMRQIVGSNNFEVVSWSSETTIRDLFGRPIIKSNAAGNIESAMQKGPYARMLSGETRGIVNDEYTAGQTASHLSLKRIYQAHRGEQINLPGFNGQVFTKEDYYEIATGNLRSKQHQQREEMDPAVAREFVSISVPFMNSQEAKQILLSSFMHESGMLQLSKREIEMINQLCRAAEFTQKAFEDEFSDEECASDLYKQIEPTGQKIHLSKTFLDSGTLFRLIGGLSGRTFSKHLRINLQREINENPHLKTLPQEKNVFKKILKAHGFDIDALEPEKFYTPVSNQSVSREYNKPYNLPSELGFLKGVKKIDENEFPDNKDLQQKIDDKIRNLLSNPNIPDSVKAQLRSREAKPLVELATIQEAKEIMQEDYIGAEEINSILGIEIKNIPPIPFSLETLLRAKERGQFLILRTNEIPADKFALANVKQTLEKAPQTRWALVTKEILGYKNGNPDSDQTKVSTSKNYLEQTEVMVNYLRDEEFAGQPIPQEYQEAIAEFEDQKEELRPLVLSTDEKVWEPAAQRLANLKISQLTRRTRDEGLYDLDFYFQKNKVYLLPNRYDWSSTVNSSGRLVCFGRFVADGAVVIAVEPGIRFGYLGLSFSRSQ